MKESILQELREIGTTSISDALDTLGMNGGCLSIRPLMPGLRCAGPAYTVRFEPVRPGESGPAADYIDDVPSGSVIVLDNGGATFCTVWGDILTACALARGVAGTVIHGCCRDSAGIRAAQYPLFSVSSYMKSGKNRVRMVARQVEVRIGETLVRPGDLVFGDDDGVLVVPADRAEEVARITAEVVDMERRVVAAIQAGSTLSAARKANGYDRFSLKGRPATSQG